MAPLLLDHLWQSTLFAAFAALLAVALGRHRAQVRYWVWFAATAKFLIPFALIAAAAGWTAAQLHAQADAPAPVDLARRVFEPMTAAGPIAAFPPRAMRALARPSSDIGLWFGLAWVLGSMGIAGWRLGQWRVLSAALARATPLAVPTPLPVVSTRAKGGPAVVGFLRPVLVLPETLTERLTPGELEAVLEHELHHARRMDNLLTLPLLLVQALFWFHPLVWWIGRRLLAERERACDEAVVGGGIDAETYARGLLEVCRLELEPSPVLAAAAAGGANLKRRIVRIMTDRSPRPLGAPAVAALTGAAAAALALPVLAGIYAGAPTVTARVMAGVAGHIAAVTAPAAGPPAGGPSPPPLAGLAPRPARITLISTAPVLAETAAYAPEAQGHMRLSRAAVVPALPVSTREPAAAVGASPDPSSSSADADVLRALAARTAYVAGADLANVRLDMRAGGACPTTGVLDAERRLGGATVSTAFDGRVRRFVDDTLGGKPRDLSPAMALAVDKALPGLQPALAARFGPGGAARLIGEDSLGRDLYVVRSGGPGYVLVLVDDLGQIAAAVFCAPA
jgi:beta-lactamase regulating signal transducer with metallopeptidase domain